MDGKVKQSSFFSRWVIPYIYPAATIQVIYSQEQIVVIHQTTTRNVSSQYTRRRNSWLEWPQ